jgi:hypothetical protein
MSSTSSKRRRRASRGYAPRERAQAEFSSPQAARVSLHQLHATGEWLRSCCPSPTRGHRQCADVPDLRQRRGNRKRRPTLPLQGRCSRSVRGRRGHLLTVAVVGFLVGSVLWFIASAKGDGTIEIGNAFASLGYMGAALVVLLLAVLGLAAAGPTACPPASRAAARHPQGWRRQGDHHQPTRVGLGPHLGRSDSRHCVPLLHRSRRRGSRRTRARAGEVIGAGATLLPAGAAGTAGARLRDAAGARPAPLAVTGSADRTGDDTATVSGTVDPRGNDVNAYFEYQDEPPGTPEAPIARSQQTVHISASAQEQSVKVDLRGLRKDQAYRVRLVAEVPSGARSEGKWVGLGPEPEKGDSPEPP